MSFLSRTVQPDGISVMGAKLSIMSLFRASSQAFNSFLLNHKAHIHLLVLNLLHQYALAKAGESLHQFPYSPKKVRIHTDIPVSYNLPFTSFLLALFGEFKRKRKEKVRFSTRKVSTQKFSQNI